MGGKRVSWVELYLDLVFVLAVGRIAHVIVAEPEMHSVWIALGIFFTLWWTWVGFAVLYNRSGADEPGQRIVFLAASVPIGVAAVAVEPTAHGDSTAFALSMALARVFLASSHAGAEGEHAALLNHRIARACLISAVLFAVSLAAPEPFRYALWLVAILNESRAMLTEDREAIGRARRERDWKALEPADPAERLDPHHFAERFGLFLIILLGEVLVEAGQAPLEGNVVAIGAAMVLAAALWWIYFDSAVEVNLKVLELSGGSPTMARAIFATGHMVPAFALLLTAAGVGLLMEEDPPRIAYHLSCIGIGIYLAGTRAFLLASTRRATLVRLAMLIATFGLGRLDLDPHSYVVLLAGWTVGAAALTSASYGGDEEQRVQRVIAKRERDVRS